MSQKWFFIAGVLFVLFAIFTVMIYSSVLTYPTLHLEQLLLHRPLTRVDCVFREWKQLGEIDISLALTLVLGIGCLLLGYRRRVLPYLFLLLLLGVGAELVGKQEIAQPVSDTVGVGMYSLFCPQITNKPRSVKFMVGLGMWWKAPHIHEGPIVNEHKAATGPLIVNDDASLGYGYPSGHALRWMFIGLITCWLVWRHVKFRVLRAVLMALCLAVAFGGGFAQFYIGTHLGTDVIGGYLFGASSACCAIALLSRNERRKEKKKRYVSFSDGG